MAKLTKIAVGVLITIGLTFGAAKGYAYWRVKSQLDELARMVRPYADLRWGGISTELQGSIEVTDVTIAALQMPEDIVITSVRIDAGDPRFLFTGLPKRPHEAPEQLSLAVRGVRIPLRGALLESLQQGGGPAQRDVCGPASMPGPAVLAAMGVENLELDLSARLQAPKGEGRVTLAFDYATRGVDELAGMVKLGGVDGGMPHLREATVRYQPSIDAYTRMTDYCASQRRSDRQAYIQSLVSESDVAFLERFGVAPGPGLREAIGRYLQQPGELKVVLRPTSELMLTPNIGHTAQYWIEAAGLQLFVNGQLVDDLSVVTTDPSAAPSPGADTEAEPDGGPVKVADASKPLGWARFQERPLKEIGDYLDYRVRVHTRDGKPPRVGRLKNVDTQQADVDQRVGGGHLVAHVRIEQISRLEVYTR